MTLSPSPALGQQLAPGLGRLTLAADSEQGSAVPENGDHFLIAELSGGLELLGPSPDPSAHPGTSLDAERHLEAPPKLLLAVADGINEFPGCGVASAVAVDALRRHLERALPRLTGSWEEDADTVAGIHDALSFCQTELLELAAREGYDVRLGTSLTGAYVNWPKAHIIHVGDARCYLLRGGILRRLTRDQTVAQKLIDAGEMDERVLRGSPLWTTLTSSIGGTGEVEVELLPLTLEPGDLLLLCTDGLYSPIEHSDLRRALRRARPDELGATVERLIERARREGSDDATIALALFHGA